MSKIKHIYTHLEVHSKLCHSQIHCHRNSKRNLDFFSGPDNVKCVEVINQTEKNITLRWVKVNNISTYFLKYEDVEENINSTSEGGGNVTYVVTSLAPGKRYDFTLITADVEGNSTGHQFNASTGK